MLTLPAEITNNKNKIAIRPILLIEFIDLDYHISSRAYDLEVGNGSDGVTDGSETFIAASATFQTWNMKNLDKIDIGGTDFIVDTITDENEMELSSVYPPDADLNWIAYNSYISDIDKGHSGGLTASIPILGGGFGSVSDYSIRLLHWEITLREEIVGSSPDLRGSNVKVYIKFDIFGSDEKTDALVLFKGQIADYNIVKDKMVLKFKAIQPVLTDLIPSSLLRDSYHGRGDDTLAVPIQFGDFAPNRLHWKNAIETYAMCPYVGITDDGYYKFAVSDHMMNEMPTGTDLIEITSSTDTTGHNPSIVGFLNNHFFKLTPTAIDSIVNTSTDGAHFIVEDFEPTDMIFYFVPTAEQQNNTATDWANAIDGDSTTHADVQNDGTAVMVDESPTGAIKIGPPAPYAGSGQCSCRVVVSIGTVIITDPDNDHLYAAVISGTSAIGGYHAGSQIEITESDADSILVGPLTFSGVDIDNVGVGVWGEGSSNVATCEIKSVMVMVYVNPNSLLDDDFAANYLEPYPYVFIKAKGKEYSGTWDTRKTAGNLIENPADMVEALLRDEVGSTNTDIDMDSFDDINGIMGLVNACCTLYQRYQAKNLLNDMCRAFAFSLNWNAAEQWRLTTPYATGMYFASSGTDSPNDEDIFTDSDTLVNEVYTNHPIVRRSMQLSRSPENSAYDKLTLNYADVFGVFLNSVSTGSGKNKDIDNKYISDGSSATALIGMLDNIYLNQHWLAKFDTWYNALAHEVGDVINIRHGTVNDDMLDSTENAQKWIVYKIKQGWHPAWATVYAMELF